MAALQRIAPVAEVLDGVQERRVGAEGEELGCPGQRVDDLGGQRAGERRPPPRLRRGAR